MEQALKAEILRDIVKAMRERDGDRLRPQEMEVEVEEAPKAPASVAPNDEDMSSDEARILEELLAKVEGEEDEAGKE